MEDHHMLTVKIPRGIFSVQKFERDFRVIWLKIPGKFEELTTKKGVKEQKMPSIPQKTQTNSFLQAPS